MTGLPDPADPPRDPRRQPPPRERPPPRDQPDRPDPPGRPDDPEPPPEAETRICVAGRCVDAEVDLPELPRPSRPNPPLDPIPTDPDGAFCYLLAHALWIEIVETGQLPAPCLN